MRRQTLDNLVVGEQHRHLGVAQHVGLLGRSERTVDAEPDGAETHRGEVADDDVDVVGQRHRDAISLADAKRHERSSGPVDLGVELGHGESSATADECHPIGSVGHSGTKQRGDRPRAADASRRRSGSDQTVSIEIDHAGADANDARVSPMISVWSSALNPVSPSRNESGSAKPSA